MREINLPATKALAKRRRVSSLFRFIWFLFIEEEKGEKSLQQTETIKAEKERDTHRSSEKHVHHSRRNHRVKTFPNILFWRYSSYLRQVGACVGGYLEKEYSETGQQDDEHRTESKLTNS